MLHLLLLAPVLLLRLAMPTAPHGRHVRWTAPPPRRDEPPARQARDLPPIPDYVAFATVANRHRSRWEITYEGGMSPPPYQARNRVTGEYVATSTVELLDLLLTIHEPPSYARPYSA